MEWLWPMIGIALTAIAVGVAIVFVRSIWRVIGSSAVSRVLAVGLTVLVYPASVTAPFQAVVDAIGYLNTVSQSSALPSPAVVPLLTALSMKLLVNPVPPLIGIALCVLFGQIFDAILGGAGGAGRLAMLLQHGVAVSSKVPGAAWRAITITLVLALGAYMIIMSISAVPYLQDYSQIPGELRPETVRQRFQSMFRSKEAFFKEYPELQISNPLADLVPHLQNACVGVTQKPAAAPIGVSQDLLTVSDSVCSLARGAGQVKSALDQALNDWHTVREKGWEAIDQVQNNFDWAVQTQSFTVASPKERAENLAALFDIAQTRIGGIEQRLQGCRTDLQDGAKMYSLAANHTETLLKKAFPEEVGGAGQPHPETPPGGVQSGPTTQTMAAAKMEGASNTASAGQQASNRMLYFELESERYQYQDPVIAHACQAGFEPVDLTNSVRSSAGQGLLPGVRVLLQTQSVPFVTIWGMLGAGLVGSIIALMRFHPEAGEDFEAVQLFGKNFVTAILLYLVVKGGLIVVSTNNTDPNTYFLLALCLIGTVFSDAIWSWARIRLTELFGAKDPNQSRAPVHDDNSDNSSSVVPTRPQQASIPHSAVPSPAEPPDAKSG
jgi:hypothetical protein